MIFFKHRRSAERDTFSVPRSVQKSIPIKRIYQDGVFQVSGKFSKTWRFFDVNYAVASPEKQRELFMTYCSFLNSLPIGATAKITLFNRQLNQKDFGRTLLMPMQGDRRDLYRNEYNALVLGKAAESNNLIQEKYITVSAEKKSVEEARAFFSRVGTDLTTGLSRMSSSVREITVNDRLRLLHDFYRPGEEQLFRFNLEDTMRRGHDFRDCIAPDCISFQKNHYELGDHVGRTLFLREYDNLSPSTSVRSEAGSYPLESSQDAEATPPRERGRQKAVQDAKTAYRRHLAEKRTAERCIAPPQPNCSGAMATPQKGNQGTSVKSDPVPKNGRPLAGASRTMRVRQVARTTQSETIIARRARAAAQRKAQWAMLRDATKDNGNTAKKLSRTAVQAVKTVGKGVASAGNSILTAGGGAAVLVLLLMVILVAAIVASPFGILLSNESREAGVVPISAAVAQINYDFNAKLETLQTADDYDSISVDGQAADWVEVLAVFAVKVAGSDDVDAADVATMDADRIARLKAVFWDMTIIAHRVEVIHHPGSGESDDGWTERNLHITIAAKTAEEMKTVYHFSRNQVAALAELLEQRDLLLELIEDVYSVSGDTASLIRGLPEDLSPEREAVVRTACSLVGKVNYFWGGKSLVIGWDARWGELRQVTAAGSSTTGTYRPYGLDCSGFVDWVFYNATNGSYIIGHGGGATMQHSYCTDISWEDARPGDLVFYPDNSHVGIVGGRDANGELLIIHCASGYNNVVITGKEGFTSVGRPQYYSD